ncbi:MAG: twin-arginine translocation signal domain-containing protein [Verrucomicrobia bacterium]|nr:twin-arginine translocation signal domain-containing protein [Verrucomicrobiota bacterium]
MNITRRQFLKQTTVACAAASLARAEEELDFPLVDFHVHLDNSTIDKVLALPQAGSVKFGIVEHAGTKENQYPIVLSNDAELAAYVKMLEGKPVYKGVQAEFSDWASGFTKAGLAQLDYVLIDAMTMPDKNGKRVKLWTKEAEIGEAQRFMDRYVDWHVEILSSGPINILANVSWLPAALMPDYDRLWTEARMRKVIEAAVKRGVAIEISASYKLPRMPFLKLSQAAGAKFTFGSNGRYPKMGLLEHSIQTAKQLGLKRRDMFRPVRQNFSSRRATG